jgi:hypothetical protein
LKLSLAGAKFAFEPLSFFFMFAAATQPHPGSSVM